MKLSKKTAVRLVGAAGLLLVGASAWAHPMGWGMGPGMMRGAGPCAAAADEAVACPMAGAGGMRGAFGAGCAYGAGKPAGAAGQPLVTDEERQAFFDKMRSATTPEERQKLAAEHRAEIQKRAAERGVNVPPGPRMGYGRGPGMGWGWGPGMMRGYGAPADTPR